MNKKLSRIDIIKYCEKCLHVKKKGLSTVCELTNDFAKFDYKCDKYTPIESNQSKKKSVLKSWIFPFVLCLLSATKFLVRSRYKDPDIISLIFLTIGIVWLIIALIRIIRS